MKVYRGNGYVTSFNLIMPQLFTHGGTTIKGKCRYAAEPIRTVEE
jgi:hypothetical protein